MSSALAAVQARRHQARETATVTAYGPSGQPIPTLIDLPCTHDTSRRPVVDGQRQVDAVIGIRVALLSPMITGQMTLHVTQGGRTTRYTVLQPPAVSGLGAVVFVEVERAK